MSFRNLESVDLMGALEAAALPEVDVGLGAILYGEISKQANMNSLCLSLHLKRPTERLHPFEWNVQLSLGNMERLNKSVE